jgi:hypothetical protein
MDKEDPLAARHRREKWRREWINRFRDRQRTARIWIEFVEIATWCAQSSHATSADHEQRAFDLACQRLAGSVLSGEFEVNGRSKILYLDPRVLSIGTYSHRLTRDWFEKECQAAAQFDEHFRLPAANWSSMNVLACCWVPRDMARTWFEAHGYHPAPHFEPKPPVPGPGNIVQDASSPKALPAKPWPPSREKPFWPAAREAAMEWLTDNGCPAPNDGNQAALEKHVTIWLEDHHHEAAESTIRRHVVCWIKERRDQLNA